MKAAALLVFGLMVAAAQAATSDMLFPRDGQTFSGTAGNVVFDGQCFVTPLTQADGAITLTLLDTNGLVRSNILLAINGSAPRIALMNSNYLLAWLDTNGGASLLKASQFSNGSLGGTFTIATNVADETLSLSCRATQPLVVWQSSDSNSAVFARALKMTGEPLNDAFAVAPSSQPQLYPSLDGDGTNHLVCWVEQNVASNDWRTVARLVANGAPACVALTVSETNSLRPHPTAAAFATNYLVAWSWDEGPFTTCYYVPQPPYCILTNYWFPIVKRRLVSPSGMPLSNSFIVARNIYANTNPAVASGDGKFLVGWINAINWPGDTSGYGSPQRLQRFNADGSPAEYPFGSLFAYRGNEFDRVRCAFGAGQFCVLYARIDRNTVSQTFAARFMDLTLVNLRRMMNGGVATDIRTVSDSSASVGGYTALASTNLVDWTPFYLPSLSNTLGQKQFFVRGVDFKWTCVERLRMIEAAKQQWAMDHQHAATDIPTDSDLFGPTRYLINKPVCPANGTYALNNVALKATCTLSVQGHTL